MPLFGRRRDPGQELVRRTHGRPGANALTASGFKVKQRDADVMRRLIQPWQARAFAYYDLVGEYNYASMFYSRALAALRLYPAMMDENGDLVETDNPDAVEQLDRIQDPGGGGRANLLASYGRLMFIAGECYLFVSRDLDTDQEQWEFISTDELRVTGGGYTRYKAPSMMAELYHEAADDDYVPVEDDTAVAYRIWKRHPRYSWLATSTSQAVLDVLEEIVLLTQVIRARARSRTAGPGILLVNGKVTPVPLEPVPDENPEEDPFVSDLTEAMTQPIVDEGTAKAVVPLVVRVDTDSLDEVMKHIQLVDPTQLYPETGLRMELIRRLAIGLDMPPEVLLGMTDANHWTSWQIDEQTWKHHLQPVAMQLCSDLSSAYFRPTLKQMGVPNWENFFIAFDATAIINHPDRTKDAKDLYDRRAIGKTALRDAAGFLEEDAPTQEELNEMLGVEIRDSSLAVYGIPQIRGTGGIEPAAGEIEQGQPGTTSAGVSGNDVAKGPPENQPDGNDQKDTPPGSQVGSADRAARIIGAADLAFWRSREMAGARIRNHAKRDKEATKLIDGVRPSQVAAVLGRERVRALGAPSDRDLVAGARELITDAFVCFGIESDLARPLGERIEQHAARTLYEEKPSPLPQSFHNYVLGLHTGESM